MKRLVGLVLCLLFASVFMAACSEAPLERRTRDRESTGGSAGTGGSSGATCALPSTQCGASCVNTQTAAANCGSCGNVCGGTTPYCSQGTCSATCPLTTCGANVCSDLTTDTLNCGACGTVCNGGMTCQNRACACPVGTAVCASTGFCTAPTACPVAAGGAAGTSGTAGIGGASGAPAGGAGGVLVAGASGASGAAAGGASGGDAAGGASGSSTAGTGGGSTTAPPGYWTSQAWHGCSWTGVGRDGVSTVTPMDFVAKAPDAAYCVSGSVGAEPEYKSVALLGFNVGEPPPADCAYEPVDVNADGPPGVAPMATGVAVNFVKRGTNTAFTWRVQLQGPNGHKEGAVGEADRWCATITEVQGKVFIPYTSFTPKCWELETAMRGTPYANQPISAVVFLVPGAPTATPFDFCVNGFTYGDSADDAPDGPEQVGNQTGTVGGTGNDDLDFDRAKVLVDGENYIIQNNNWGNPGGSDCIMSYVNNSFTVTSCTGSGSSAPAAFPSIYQGNNGNTANGVYSTKSTDSMPIQVSNIASITSTFRYSGVGGNVNATYDIWFANSIPTAEYKDGINGFVMIWLYDPQGAMPIGGSPQGSVTIAGQTWNKWVGPRGAGPDGNNNAPVVSFVNPAEGDNSRAQSFVNKNILEFIQAAAGDGISSSMYLTDIFAGFEIWSGGTGAKVDEFKAVVTPK